MPAAEDRRYWTHQLLLWQASDGSRRLGEARSRFDGREYCEEAGERYAYSAEKLILGTTVSAETTEGKRAARRWSNEPAAC